MKPFSLFRRGRLNNALGRFPDLGFNLLAAPSRPDLDFRFQIFDFRFKSKIPNPKSKIPLSSDLRCGFRRHYSGGTAPDCHRSSLTPRASNIEAKATSRKKRCQVLFSSVAFHDLHFTGRETSLPQRISQSTSGIVMTEKKVLSTTTDAARFGS